MKPTAVLSIFHIKPDQYLFHLETPGAGLGRPEEDTSRLFAATTLDTSLRSHLAEALESAVMNLRLFHASTWPPAQTSNSSDASLKRLGRLLFSLILPPVFQEALRHLPARTPLILSTNDAELPWELFHDGETFLMLKHPTSRQLLSTTRARKKAAPTHLGKTFLFVTNPKGDLPEAYTEAEQLLDIFETVAEEQNLSVRLLVGDRARKTAVLQALSDGYDVIHYSGHAETGSLLLAEGALTADEISKAAAGHPFIFLNACWSARGSMEADSLPHAGLAVRDLASAFILGGAAALVGTLWPVFDASSRQFAEKFYELALTGVPVGEALRQTRLWVRDHFPNDPLWASYVFYGDPNLRLLDLEQRRSGQITVLMACLTNMSRLLKGMSLERGAEIREQILDRFAQAAQRYGGEIHGPVHHTLSVRFGVTSVHEDDAERAVRTALDVVEGLPRVVAEFSTNLPTPPGVKLGISTGQAVVRQLNVPLGEAVHVTSAASDVAIALAEQAGAGQILIDPATQHLVRGAITCQAVKTDAVAAGVAYRVVPDNLRPSVRPKSIIVGRDSQLNQLVEWWQAAAAGEGGLVSIVGEAGAGKTSLVQAFKRMLADERVQWFEVACKSYNQSVSYALLSQLLIALAGIQPPDPPAVRQAKVLALVERLGDLAEEQLQDNLALLGEVIGLPGRASSITNLDPELRQKRLAELMGLVLTQLADSLPVVLILEDLHWADEASLSVLHQMGRTTYQIRGLLLAVYRPGQVHAWERYWDNYDSVRLNDLSAPARRRLLKNLLDDPALSEGVMEAILSLTKGSPFLIEEAVKALRATNVLVWEENEWRLLKPPSEVLPTTLSGIILARLAHLDGTARAVLEAASVIGEAFEYQVLVNTLFGALGDNLNSHLEYLIDQKVIRREGGLYPNVAYAFQHGLIQQTIYDGLLAREQRRLHGQVARALVRLHPTAESQERVLERIAHHYFHSSNLLQAVPYCLRAGQHAARMWANETALKWYQRAWQRLEEVDEKGLTANDGAGQLYAAQGWGWRVEALEGRAYVQSVIGRYDEAVADYRLILTMMAEVDQPAMAHHADLYRKIAIAYTRQGDFEAAQRMLERGLDALAGDIGPEAGRLHTWIGINNYYQGESSRALASCERAIAILKQVSDHLDLETNEAVRDFAQAYELRGLVVAIRGDNEQALDDLEQSIRLYHRADYLPGIARATSKQGFVYQNRGQWTQALQCYRRSEQLSARTGETLSQAATLINLGEIYRRQGNLDEAIAANQKARQLSETFGFTQLLGVALMNIGACRLKAEDIAAAQDHLEKGLHIFQKINDEANRSEVLCHLVELGLKRGEVDQMLALAQEALKIAEKLEGRLELGRAYRVLGQVYRARGRLEEARAYLDESLVIFEAAGNPHERGLTLLERALLWQTCLKTASSAAQHFQADCAAATAIFEKLGAELDLKAARALQPGLPAVTVEPARAETDKRNSA